MRVEIEWQYRFKRPGYPWSKWEHCPDPYNFTVQHVGDYQIRPMTRGQIALDDALREGPWMC